MGAYFDEPVQVDCYKSMNRYSKRKLLAFTILMNPSKQIKEYVSKANAKTEEVISLILYVRDQALCSKGKRSRWRLSNTAKWEFAMDQ